MIYHMKERYLKSHLISEEEADDFVNYITNGAFNKWNDTLEVFTSICEDFDYSWKFYNDGRVVVEDKLLDSGVLWKNKNEKGHYEYKNVNEMLIDHLSKLINSNYDYSNEIMFIKNLKEDVNIKDKVKEIISKYYNKNKEYYKEYYTKFRYEKDDKSNEKEIYLKDELEKLFKENNIPYKISEEDGYDSPGYSNDFMAITYIDNNGNIELETIVFEFF